MIIAENTLQVKTMGQPWQHAVPLRGWNTQAPADIGIKSHLDLRFFFVYSNLMIQPSIIHADLDAFFASVEQKLNPALQNKPVIVTNTNPQGRLCNKGIVSTCSYEARRFGVRSGMSVWQARQLCPKGIYVQGQYEQYNKHSQAFFSVLKDFSPYVEPISLDEGFVSLQGAELLYKDFTQTAFKIQERIKKEVGLSCSLGLAKTKIVAKVASDFKKPYGLTVVPVGFEKTFLAPLPLRALPGIGAKTEIVLKTLLPQENPTIGNFALLSQKFVEKNLGQSGLNLWKGANGYDSIWFVPREESQKSISRSMTFPKASTNPVYLLAQIRTLVERISQELFENNLTTSCVSFTLRTQQFQNHSQQLSCQPLWQAQEIYQLSKKLFFSCWQPSTLIRLVGVHTSQLKPKDLTLFDFSEQKSTKLSESLVKIRSKHGFRKILPASNLLL